MKARRANVWVVLTLVWGWSGNLWAQSLDADRGGDPGKSGGRVDAYVDDSFEANERLRQVEGYARQGRWVEASHLVQRIFESHADRLVRVDDHIYESVVARLNRMVASWPAEGIRVYGDLYDRSARRAFERAMGQRDHEALTAALDRYFCTSVASSIAAARCEIALEAGDFALARWIGLRMIEDHPDRRLLEESFTARLAVIAALEGREAEAGRWLQRYAERSDRPSIQWMGREENVSSLVPALVSEALSARQVDESFSWPVFAGDGTRNRPGAFAFERMALLWRFDESRPMSQEPWSPGSESSSSRHGMESGKHLMFNPVVGAGMIFVQSAYEVWALQQSSGALSWRYGVVSVSSVGHSSGDGAAAEWYSPTLEGDRLYVCLGQEGVPYYGYDSSTHAAAVVCLDARSGTQLWRVDQDRLGADFAKMTFGASPLVSGENLFVVGRRRRTFGFEDCYLLRFRTSDGELLRQTHLGSASTGGFGYRRPSLSIPATADGTVFVATNLGTVAAVSAHTGRVKWLYLYEREPEESWRSAARSTIREISPWQYNPVLYTPERLICRPNDAQVVLILDPSSGRLERVIDTAVLENVGTLLGVVDGRLYGVGDKVFCFDLDADAMLWSAPLPDGAELFGRGTLTKNHILIPTRRVLCGYDMGDGTREAQPWDSADAAGNLLAMPDQLVVSGTHHIAAYGRRADVWARLRDTMAARPDDPVPALDLAEIAFRTGDREEAKEVFDEAVKRAGAFAAAADDAIRVRMFQDCIWFARDWPRENEADLERVRVFYEYAGQCAPDTAAHIKYRFRFAEFLATQGEPDRAVHLYQQVLSDRSLRESTIDSPGANETAGGLARQAIADLLNKHGRQVYAPFEAEAAEWLQAARSSGNLGLLDRILETRPLSVVAPEAMMLKGRLLRRTGRPEAAARTFMSTLNRYRDRMEPPALMRMIADCYAEAGKLEHAWRWLTKAAYEYPEARVELPGGSVTFLDYRRRFEEARSGAEVRLPRVRPPLTKGYERAFEQDVTLLEPVLPASPQSDWAHVYLYSQGEIHALEARTGRLLWKESVGARVQPELLLATSDRVILATPHQVLGLDADTGKEIWSFGQYPAGLARPETDPEQFPTFFGHAYHNGRLVSIQDDGRAACVDVTTGRTLWQHKLEHRPASRLAVSEQWLAYRGIGATSTAYCVLDAGTGKLLRTIEPVNNGHVARFRLTPHGQLMVVQFRSLSAYDLQSGRLAWQSIREGNIVDSTVAFDLDGVYLSDDATHIKKISFDDGSTVWQSEPLFRFGMQSARTLLRAGLLIVMSDREVFGIDTVDGRTLWEGKSIPGARFRYTLVGSSCVVAIDDAGGDGVGMYTSYFFEHRQRSARPAKGSGVLELGAFDDVRRVVLRDDAIVLQNGRRIYGWTSQSNTNP